MRMGKFAAWILWLFLPLGNAFALGDRPPPEPTDNYQGMWWGSPAGSESGWAIGIAHQGKTIRATWFTYDTDGSPMWLVMPEGGRRTYTWLEDVYTGPLYRTTAGNSTLVGTAQLSFIGSGYGRFTYTVNGSTRSKTIEKQVFSTRLPRCEVGGVPGSVANYTDLWVLESGGSIHIAHQGDAIFAAWFTYRADGMGEWLVMPNGVRIDDSAYSGTLYRTRGPAFDANPWNPSMVAATPVGRAIFSVVKEYISSEASDTYREYAMFDFLLDGTLGSKSISRETFAFPVTVCNGD